MPRSAVSTSTKWMVHLLSSGKGKLNPNRSVPQDDHNGTLSKPHRIAPCEQDVTNRNARKPSPDGASRPRRHGAGVTNAQLLRAARGTHPSPRQLGTVIYQSRDILAARESARRHRRIGKGWLAIGSHPRQSSAVSASKPGTVTVAGKLSVDVPVGTLGSIWKQAGLKKS
jgi:predicted RNA binding protein YcfA (HicA-like mRNA interferase family)